MTEHYCYNNSYIMKIYILFIACTYKNNLDRVYTFIFPATQIRFDPKSLMSYIIGILDNP